MTRFRSMLWMSLALLLLGIALLVPDLMAYKRPPSRSHQSAATSASGASSSASLTDPVNPQADESTAADTDDPQRLDVRGNEITSPVARYRVDERGSLYEVHSPQTEVPRLKAPVM